LSQFGQPAAPHFAVRNVMVWAQRASMMPLHPMKAYSAIQLMLVLLLAVSEKRSACSGN
jgi:hypothetical protein